MNLRATIIEIQPSQKKENYTIRLFRVEYQPNVHKQKFPHVLEFHLLNDHCKRIDGFKKGDYVNIEFNLKGKVNGQWCNMSLEALTIVKE